MRTKTKKAPSVEAGSKLRAAHGRCSGAIGSAAALYEITKVIKRLETVAYRINCCQMGKDWTRRKYDADIINLECIPALRRALTVMPNGKGVARPLARHEEKGPQRGGAKGCPRTVGRFTERSA